MRVVAGLYRHRELVMPKGDLTRPTKDMVKEALFSALGNKVENAVTLDLFAGSGSLGIEALSRGAKFAYFIDKDKEAVLAIRKNIMNLKIDNAEVMMLDYKKALEKLKDKNILFDMVLIDPPYVMDAYQEIIDYLNNNHLLSEHATLVLESDRALTINGVYQKTKDYKYGKTLIKILWK